MTKKAAGNPLKYALIERERKFLLAAKPDLIKNLPFKTITDHYINDTYLRLRKVSDSTGSVYKLTKKTPGETADKTIITTIYLTEQEYNVLNKFESVRVEKIRFFKEIDKVRIGINKYANGDDELWLAEIEFDDDEHMHSFKMPLDFMKEVTGDPVFSGYYLAKRFRIK